MKEKIFLSAVTTQFRECRDALRTDLAAIGAEVVVQEDFTQHKGTLLQKLEGYIDSCDRVIALVGTAYGSEPEPATTPKNSPRRSYSQWEFSFALGERLNGKRANRKPMFVYMATPIFLESQPIKQSAYETTRQQRFIEEICASGKDRNKFDSVDELARLVLRDGFKLKSPLQLSPQNLPYDSIGSLFKGRERSMADIRSSLPGISDQAVAIRAKQALHGLGGIGKTRLAVEFAWQYQAQYSALLFVEADSAENLSRNIGALCGARILNLPEKAAREEKEQFAAALRWLRLNPGWLLILDNVDSSEARAAVDSLLPSLPDGHVLITSRRSDWSSTIRPIQIDTLSDQAAAELLLEKTEGFRTHSDTESDTALSLAQTMDGLVLALEQAGAFINKKRISLEEYLKRWNQQEGKLRQWHDKGVMNYPKSLAITWDTSFANLTRAAQSLLNLLSFFAPDPVPHKLFEAGFDFEDLHLSVDDHDSNAPPDLEDILEELNSHSLIHWRENNSNFTVHRLVQEITQSGLIEPHRQHLLGSAVNFIYRLVPTDPAPDDFRSWEIWDPLRPHIERIVGAGDFAGIRNPTSHLIDALGIYMYSRSLFSEAERLMRRSLEIHETSFGLKHPEVAASLSNLVQLLLTTNRPDEAEPLIRRALELYEHRYGPNHPRVASSLNSLAQLLHTTNRLKEAEPLMNRVLDIYTSNYGPDHPKTTTGLTNLAQLLYDTNRLKEAEPLMRRALSIDESAHGPFHPAVADDLNNLARLFQSTGQPEEAETLLRRALDIDEACKGPKHTSVARDLSNLSSLLVNTKRLEEAESLMRRALGINEVSYGLEHPIVAAVLNNLGLLLWDTDRVEEAESVMLRALKIDEASFGEEHPTIARDLNNLAQLLQATNRLQQAEALSRRHLNIYLTFCMRTGHEHTNLNSALNNYRALLTAMGREFMEIEAEIQSMVDSARERFAQ